MRAFILLGAVFFCLAGFSAEAKTATVEKFVRIAKGRSLFIHWDKAEEGKPTAVLLNGLTYSTEDWDRFAEALREKGYGVFRYDPYGMGETLEKSGAVEDVIRIEDQARDLDLVTKAVGLTGRLHLVGLSYGGGLAIAFARDYAERIESAVLMAPFTKPLAQQDSWIRSQILWTRLTFPLNPATDEELYAFFLRQNVYYVYPYSEPSMLRSPLKPEAVFQMTQGIRQYDMISAAKKFPARALHLVVAGMDQYIPRDTLDSFWNGLPARVRGSRLILDYSEHKIPEAFPSFAAAWVAAVMTKQDGLDKGRSYEADPTTGKVTPLP
jgi:pimeloyl-ACP methyl ester carboxylesterase